MRLRIALAKFQTPPILRSAFNNFVLEDVKHFRFGQRFLFTVYDRKELPIRCRSRHSSCLLHPAMQGGRLACTQDSAKTKN